MQPTPQQVNAAQGTRLSERAPWETYGDEMSETLSPELEAAVAEYAQNYHDNSSNQNKEELARWQEENYAAMGEYRFCSPEEYADVLCRVGRVIHSSELINILRNKLHVRCWYRQHPQDDKITLLVQRGFGVLEPEVGCWVKNGWMPEYSVMGFDDHGVPTAERYRGWRTVLLQLILKDVVTEENAHKIFGRAERNCAERYNKMLHSWRNRGHEYQDN